MNPIEISPEEFERLCERVLKIAVEYLQDINARRIPPEERGTELPSLYRPLVPETGMGLEAIPALADVVRHSRAQNGRFFGYVLGSGDPVAAATDLLCSVLNQNVTAWRSAPAAVTIERTVVDWLAQAIGCQDFRGVLTGGGSNANLMALAMAREANAPANEQGVHVVNGLAIYASTEVHMSIPKAIALLGLGRENLRPIPVDESFRMVPEQLEHRIRQDKEMGITPIAVVGTAGTVNTGAIDPLLEIAAIAKQYAAWLHIDGAYGALGAIAAPMKFEGLALADSISLDPHKWLYQPIDCGCLLYRDAGAAQRAFANSGEYVRVLSDDPIEGYAVFEESIELSRRFRALKLWFSLRYHGFGSFRKSIEKDLLHAQRLGNAIDREPELELLAPVELSAVCFRYVGNGSLTEHELNRVNFAILRRVIERGHVYLSNATLQSKFCLRACIVNHRTSDADIDDVTREVLSAARDLI
jgi:glutamate/tyrosine decarboxylase-like PLP-dependent enzyme